MEVERLHKDSQNMSLSQINDTSMYRQRNDQLVQEVAKLRDQLKEKEKKIIKDDIRMSILLEKDYSFLEDADLGSMKESGHHNWDAPNPQNGGISNEKKEEYEFK